MAPPAQGFDPLLSQGGLAKSGGGKAAAEVDAPLVEEAAQAQGGGLFDTAEAWLGPGHPGELLGGDDAAGEGLQEKLADGHGSDEGL